MHLSTNKQITLGTNAAISRRNHFLHGIRNGHYRQEIWRCLAYAEEHPEIVAAFMQTAAIANLESVLLEKLENIEKTIDQLQ